MEHDESDTPCNILARKIGKQRLEGEEQKSGLSDKMITRNLLNLGTAFSNTYGNSNTSATVDVTALIISPSTILL